MHCRTRCCSRQPTRTRRFESHGQARVRLLLSFGVSRQDGYGRVAHDTTARDHLGVRRADNRSGATFARTHCWGVMPSPGCAFENLEAYPDFVFVLHFRREPWYGPATPEQSMEIPPGVPFTMPGSGFWRDHLYVEAIPRNSGRVPQSAALQSPRDYVTSVNLYQHYVTPYRITIEAGELAVTRCPPEGGIQPRSLCGLGSSVIRCRRSRRVLAATGP